MYHYNWPLAKFLVQILKSVSIYYKVQIEIDKIKKNIYHIVGPISKSLKDRNNRGKINIPNIYIHDCLLSRIVLKPPLLMQRCDHVSVGKMPPLHTTG